MPDKVHHAVQLRDGWMETEKGNTMLTSDDGSIVVWIAVDSNLMLEIENTPGNSPSFYISVQAYEPKKLRNLARERCAGWYCNRWNLDDHPPVNDEGYITGREDD